MPRLLVILWRARTALVLAMVVVLGVAWWVDHFALAPGGPWAVAAQAAQPVGSIERSVLASQRALARAAAVDRGLLPQVLLLGPGRALDAPRIGAVLPEGVVVSDLTQQAMGPFELLAAAEELSSLHPDIVLVEFCCLETHRPLRVGLQTAPGSLAAVRRLRTRLGSDAERHAGLLVTLEAAALFNVVREHDLLTVPALPPGPQHPAMDLRTTWELAAEAPREIDLPTLLEQARSNWPQLPPALLEQQVLACHAITRGRHADVQMNLLLAAVDRLLATGAKLVLVESPLHPFSRKLFERPIWVELLDALSPLAARGVLLLTEQQTGPYPPSEFDDLLHLGPAGRQRLANSLRLPLNARLGD